ncbi:alpha/beta hydrolase [Wolbachia endosymbiont of Tribolium confusum]|uniref:alpha/beta hydrolase n=1 Tax=Wolbachia endosymbiont of Tribolium confusum TaxID=214474 RepID=UPI001CF1439E|nr:alpha/beta hydrolase [Wolbachia endosymbiont of Tribolium confusum]MCA7010061.1 alpha/beta hydrolase [Wolbachia endosymbiont of Tribolium confusum]
MIPFINKNQSLSQPSIKEISKLIDKGVKSENIILFGHSFGGAVASEVLKNFADRNVKLGGVIFYQHFQLFSQCNKAFSNSSSENSKCTALLFVKKNAQGSKSIL